MQKYKPLLLMAACLALAAFTPTAALADRTVELDWDDSPGATSYEISQNDGGGHWGVVYFGVVSEVTFEAFPDATTSLRIRPYNGIWGEYVNLTVPAAAPAPVTGLVIVSSVDNPAPPPPE